MDYVYRLRCRVNDEGFVKTIKYAFHILYFSMHDFIEDSILDLKYSKKLLRGNSSSKFKHLGANDVYHTKYSAMPLIFRHITISPEDVLVDVGCGKGRMINYWLSKKYSNQIVGLELDPEVAKQTTAQFFRWKNVKIIPGDAITNLPQEGTIFYFYNPFSLEKVKEFERRIADISQRKVVKIIYYNPKSIHVFNNGNWDVAEINFERDFGIKRWGRINKFHDLAIITRHHN